MKNDLRNAFIEKRYKSIEDLLELEKVMSQAGKKLLAKMPPEKLMEEIKNYFDLVDIFYQNLLALSLEDRAEFLVRHKKVNITKISHTFDIDWKAAKDIFQYLKLCNVGTFSNNYITIKNPEEFKMRLVNRLNKEI